MHKSLYFGVSIALAFFVFVFAFLGIALHAFAFTDNSVLPTIQPITVSFDFDASDAAVCLASNPADAAFVISTYNPAVGYNYDGGLFTSLPFTLSTSTFVGHEFSTIGVYCTADGVNPDYGAPNWFYSLSWSGNGVNYTPYTVVDGSSTLPVSTSTVTSTDTIAVSLLFFMNFALVLLGFCISVWIYKLLV